MAYWKDVYDLGDSREIEYKYAGNYGGRGEKRTEHIKRTPEQIKKQNQDNRIKNMRRTLKLNFKSDDYWMTLKYPKGTRKTMKEVKSDLSVFLKALRDEYRIRGQTLKWIRRIEIGHLGGVHIHMVINRLTGPPGTDVIVKKLWPYYENYELIYGDHDRLASYICKPPDSDDGQMTMFGKEEKKCQTYISSSRNLIRPKDVMTRKRYSHWTMRRILKEPKPSKGYYIDWDTWYQGVNPYTGMSYLHYTERKLNRSDQSGGGEEDGS